MHRKVATNRSTLLMPYPFRCRNQLTQWLQGQAPDKRIRSRVSCTIQRQR